MQLHRASALFTLALAAFGTPTLAHAAVANCMSAFGSCEVSNDGFDWTECMCADGSGVGGGGGNMWAGLSELELAPICEEQLASFCGPFLPPEFIACYGVLGSCTIDNDPVDSIACECLDGTTGGVPGGGAWAGWSEMQLYAECEAQLDMVCVPPAGALVCSNANGECAIANAPEDFLACECAGGDGGGWAGGNAWAGYSELDLFDECGTQLVGLCGGALPAPPWAECSSTLGECILDNDPEDSLECTCSDGETISQSGGSEWAGLSPEELFMECEEQLYAGCSVDVGSGSATDTGEGGDTSGTGDGGTSSGGTTGEPGESTGLEGSSGTPGGSSGTPEPVTTGDDTTGDPAASDDGAAGGGCSCAASQGHEIGGWALALLGLVGLRGRRRTRARR